MGFEMYSFILQLQWIHTSISIINTAKNEFVKHTLSYNWAMDEYVLLFPTLKNTHREFKYFPCDYNCARNKTERKNIFMSTEL